MTGPLDRYYPEGVALDDARTVDVWIATLPEAESHLGALRSLLNADEVARADRFAVDDARHQFIVGRGCLRLLLGAVLDIDARDVAFVYGALGRPALLAPRPVAFNVSHSGELVVVAVTGATTVGIDVERIRADVSCADLAEEHFCAVELERFRSAAPDVQTRMFFAHWVRKEAVAKAIGDGLSIPLQSVCVMDDPLRAAEAPAAVRHGASAWATYGFGADPEYAAAVAMATSAARLVVRRWRWPASPPA